MLYSCYFQDKRCGEGAKSTDWPWVFCCILFGIRNSTITHYSKIANFHYFLVVWGKGTAFIGARVINRIPVGVADCHGHRVF